MRTLCASMGAGDRFFVESTHALVWWRSQLCSMPCGSGHVDEEFQIHRKPIDSHGNAATTMRATISAKMYGQIRQIASSGEILPMAHAP